MITIKHSFTAAALCLFANASFANSLADFNLIVLGDLTTGTSEVEGRTLIFGDITASSTLNFGILPESISTPTSTPGVAQNDSLIVGGQTFTQLNVNNGNARFGGAPTSVTINNNAGSVTFNDAAAIAPILNTVTADIAATTTFFDSLTANSTANLNDFNLAIFNSNPGTDNIAVFDLDASFFSRNGTVDLQGNLSADLFLFRLLDEDTTTLDVSTALNFFANEFNDDAFQSRIAFYLPNVELLDLPNGIGGAVIAPNADVTFGSPLEGTVVVNNLALNSEIHLPALDTSAIPEPSSLALLAGGALFAGMRRRRK